MDRVITIYPDSETSITLYAGEVGPRGEPGEDSTVPGPQGIQGVQGEPGLDGADSIVAGPQGSQGIQGIQGVAGDPATNLVTSVAGRQGVVVLTKSDVGLSAVDNTSDANKPVSTAAATADSLRVLKAGDTMTGNLVLNGTLASTSWGTFAADLGIGANVRSVVPYGMFGILNTTGTNIPVIIRGASGQSVPMLRIQDNGGTTFFEVDQTGKITIGADTNLYRSAANTLATDDAFSVSGTLTVSGTSVISPNVAGAALSLTNTNASGGGVQVQLDVMTNRVFASIRNTGDTQYRFYIDGNGKMLWGSGSTAPDVNLYRVAADVLKTDDTFQALALNTRGALVTTPALATYVAAEGNARFAITADGNMVWGSGATAGDTNLYRDVANVLKTDDSLKVGGTLEVGTKPTITGSRSGNAALASLLTALAATGLITDSTSA